MRNVIVVLTAFTLSVATFVQAESLGEVAAREKEKRKGKKDGKVITETELFRAKGSGTSITDGGFVPAAPDEAKDGKAADGKAPAASGEKAKDAPKEKTEEEVRAENLKAWRTRMDQANANVSAAQKQVSDLEATPGLYSNAAATAQLADARRALTAAREVAAGIEEEGRRSNFR
jgi:hypothetical protein